jgi:phosphoglycerate kinase
MTTGFLFADEMDLAGQRVLLRLDVNVPIQDGQVSDDTRIRRILPGLQALVAARAKIIILTHFGRPKGKIVPDLSIRPVANCMTKLLGQTVVVEKDVIGAGGAAAVAALQSGNILMMENLRFYPEEEANDQRFAKKLAALGDIYVGDAFSCAHRAHASVDALPRLMPSAAGRSFAAELTALNTALAAPRRPLAAVVGGAKVSSKLALIENLVTKVDGLIFGGGMANTFLLAQGIQIGASLAEPDMVAKARAIVAKADANCCRIILPTDLVVATAFAANASHRVTGGHDIADDEMILDAGPQSIASVTAFLRECQTIVWNGPMGAFELKPFDAATNAVARAVARLTQDQQVLSVAGGGDTMAALANAGVNDHFTYVSTAGGAFLEWLEGKTLPGVDALQQRQANSACCG